MTLSEREFQNRLIKIVRFNNSINNLKDEIHNADNRLEKVKNKSSDTYKNGLKLRNKLKNKLKERNNLRKEYLNIISSENMVNMLNKEITRIEKFIKNPSERPTLNQHGARELNATFKKAANDIKNLLKKQNVHATRRMNSKRASTSGRR
jgi:DNA repair ATPase RecN